MKLTWNKNPKKRPRVALPNILDDVSSEKEAPDTKSQRQDDSEVGGTHSENDDGRLDLEAKKLAESFRSQGDKLAEEGRYEEALGKWEAALNIVPENAVVHEQKAQVFLEIGDPWKALKSATRATEIDPSWAEAWITLGRAQLNFGEPDSAIRSFETALSINAESKEAKEDLQAAKQLIKKREQLQSSGLDTDAKRFVVGDKNIEPLTNETETCTLGIE
ncbi:TPR_REGION domain-containing protein [Hirschfeldia incana]|nr:TPR_REGION domain-containing protein [Hirschfeldia incana]